MLYRNLKAFFVTLLLLTILIVSNSVTMVLGKSSYSNTLNFSSDSIITFSNNEPVSMSTSDQPISLSTRDIDSCSWVDSFQDDSKIEVTKSDHINSGDGEAKISSVIKGPLPLDSNTLALWHMDSGSGSTVTDQTTNNNDGTISGASWVTGKFNKGLKFDGGGQWYSGADSVRVPHSSSLDITGNFTIEAWVKAKGTDSYLTIVDKYRGTMTLSWGYTFYITMGRIRLSIYSGSYGYETASGNKELRDDKWHYVVGVFNGSHVSVYTDGLLDSAKPWTYPPGSTTNDLGIGKRLTGWGGYIPFEGVIDDVRISNIARSRKEIWEYYYKIFDYEGNLTSKTITKSSTENWDTVIINRTQPISSFVNITILNASNDQPIPGTPVYKKDGEFDISYIDPAKYNSIRLKAKFIGNGTITPELHYWGVSWNATNTWKDTFFGGVKTHIFDKIKIEVHDGRAVFNEPSNLTSISINIPTEFYFDTLIINKLNGAFLKVTIFDATTDLKIPGFENLYETSIDLSSINPIRYPTIKLKATFESASIGDAYLYDWSVNWTKNTPPIIESVITDKTSVNRTHAVGIEVNLSDLEESEDRITLKIEYQSPSGTSWETEFLNSPNFFLDRWVCTFSPSKYATLGVYTFRITCNDSFQYSYTTMKIDFIDVSNNKPTQPKVTISPTNPRSTNNLIVDASESYDVETRGKDLKYWYRWYKDDDYMSDFENMTMVQYIYTIKNETWRCVVYPFDGIDVGLPAEAEVTINNTPPELSGEFVQVKMIEDSSIILPEKLTNLFIDADSENLTFSVVGQDKIAINITPHNGTLELTPEQNWFGTEYLTFHATDSSNASAHTTVEVVVTPVNDLPKILKIGNKPVSDIIPVLGFTVDQNEWLNLSITVEDIDGDVSRGMISCVLNLTERSNFYLRDQDMKIIFHPGNQDVGWHHIDIRVTDNNETPLKYISQPIRIRVINLNDPPTVNIIEPNSGVEVLNTDLITFACVADDIDLELKDSVENLSFLWSTNSSALPQLGTGQELINLTLPPGDYNITVIVVDASGVNASDFVHILVKEIPKDDQTSMRAPANYLWLVVLIIIIFISIMLLFVFYNRRKSKLETTLEGLGITGAQPQPQPGQISQSTITTPTQSMLATTTTIQTVSGTPLATAAASAPKLAQPVAPAQPTLAAAPESLPQLPPAQSIDTDSAGAEVVVPEQKVEIETSPTTILTPQQKLALLEERLLLGEVDEELYLNLKVRYDQEAEAARAAKKQPTTTPQQVPQQQPQQPQQPISTDQPKPQPASTITTNQAQVQPQVQVQQEPEQQQKAQQNQPQEPQEQQ